MVNKSEEKKITLVDTIKNNLYILKFIYKLSPFYVYFTIISKIITYSSYALINVIFVKKIIDSVSDKKDMKEILYIILYTGIIYIILMIYDGIINFYNAVKRTNIIGKIQRLLLDKASHIDLLCYDDPKFYNAYVKAAEQGDSQLILCVDTIAEVSANILSMLLIGGIVFSVDPIIALFPFASFFISILTQVYINKQLYKYDMEKAVINRKSMYSKRVFYQADYAKELKMTNIRKPLKFQFELSIKELRELADKYGMKLCVLYLIYWIFSYTFFSFFCTPIYLAWGVLVANTLTMGSMASMNNASNRMRGFLLVLNQTFAKIHNMGLYSENFKKFIEYETSLENINELYALPDKPCEITINNLCFKYSTNSDFVLENVSMNIKPYEKIAIVGYNGAGKSTLIKLILNLYKPDIGTITYNNINIKDYNTHAYRRRFATIFQDFQIYAASIKDNIIMNDCTYDEFLLDKSIKNCELSYKIDDLPQGIQTQIHREFCDDGTVLSGGESQKLAMARVFYSNAPVIIMDEPSSALDPLAEYELNKNIFDHSKNKTVIFISHRLSTTRFVDRIYMFDSGKIVEQGTHDELITLNGKYASMYSAQAEKYQL